VKKPYKTPKKNKQPPCLEKQLFLKTEKKFSKTEKKFLLFEKLIVHCECDNNDIPTNNNNN